MIHNIPRKPTGRIVPARGGRIVSPVRSAGGPVIDPVKPVGPNLAPAWADGWAVEGLAERQALGYSPNGKTEAHAGRAETAKPWISPFAWVSSLTQGQEYLFYVLIKAGDLKPAAPQFTLYMGGTAKAFALPSTWTWLQVAEPMGTNDFSVELRPSDDGWIDVADIQIYAST